VEESAGSKTLQEVKLEGREFLKDEQFEGRRHSKDEVHIFYSNNPRMYATV